MAFIEWKDGRTSLRKATTEIVHLCPGSANKARPQLIDLEITVGARIENQVWEEKVD